jgi:hypothetical protein
MADDQDIGSDLGVVLGSVDGIEVVLRGVQCGSDGVVIHLYGRPSKRTDRLDAEYRVAFEEWAGLAVAAKERDERPPAPPPQPGELLNGLALTLRDDVDTTYRWHSTQAAGSGTEWDAVWRFAPGPPPESRRPDRRNRQRRRLPVLKTPVRLGPGSRRRCVSSGRVQRVRRPPANLRRGLGAGAAVCGRSSVVGPTISSGPRIVRRYGVCLRAAARYIRRSVREADGETRAGRRDARAPLEARAAAARPTGPQCRR